MYTDNENQIDYAEKMKSDLLAVQNIKIKLFQSMALSTKTILNIMPHLMGKYEGKVCFVPSNQYGLDIEIILSIGSLSNEELDYIVKDLVFNLLQRIKLDFPDVLTPQEWTYLFNTNYIDLLYTSNRFPEILIIRF